MKGSTRSIARWTAVMALVATLVAVPVGPALAQSDLMNTVTVAAGAEIELLADTATINFVVQGRGKTAVAATRRLARRTDAVVTALLAAGIAEADLSVGSVNVRRRTDRKGRFLGFLASAVIKVETQDLDSLGNVIDVAVSAGATGVRRLRYEVKDRSQAVHQALREAMTFARAKATSLAEADGRQVGRALVITEHDTTPPRPIPVADAVAAVGGGASAGVITLPISPPVLTALARITVTFELV